ncbi:MAG: hypothetical protein ACR652_02705, partial [Methylocystis sp.]|uniref:hypothetical protein n=1 Tax=Methylocystis sp. TaxID=1911079 RepID=UPI003DA265E2
MQKGFDQEPKSKPTARRRRHRAPSVRRHNPLISSTMEGAQKKSKLTVDPLGGSGYNAFIDGGAAEERGLRSFLCLLTGLVDLRLDFGRGAEE